MKVIENVTTFVRTDQQLSYSNFVNNSKGWVEVSFTDFRDSAVQKALKIEFQKKTKKDTHTHTHVESCSSIMLISFELKQKCGIKTLCLN